MTTTLSEGVKVPDVGSVNWAGDLEVNWNLLNGALANLSGNVKTDRDNTWTGEQSFTLPIVGSITGTASKAIADEDGTSIKSGYVNVAGQTVSGQKDWSNLQTFSYGQIRIKSLSQEIGVTPATSIIQYLEFADKNNVQHGKVGLWDYDNGASEIQLSISDKYKDGIKDSTGTSDTAFLSFGFQYNGTKFLTFSGQVNNSIIPLGTNAYALGSSSYQWSSVYAQSYYYNGTAWGLDKSNVWTENNRYTGFIDLQYTQSGGYSDIRWLDELNTTIACFRNQSDSLTLGKKYTGKIAWYQGSQFSLLSNGLAVIKGYDGTNYSSVVLSGNAFYPDTSNINLGISGKKWSTVNGINPGALGMPNITAGVDIASSIADVTGGDNWYEPAVDGYLSVIVQGTVTIMLFNTTHRQYYYGVSCMQTDAEGNSWAYLPVKTPYHVRIRVIGTVAKAVLYPCLGNV